MAELRKIRAGLYETDIPHQGCRPLPGRKAGGPIQIERIGRRWEPWCPSCLLCDPNDYGTLQETARETAGEWDDG